MKRLFNDRKNLYIVLSIILVSVLSLTIVYGAMSTVLRINGSAEVVASNWDIHLDNVNLMSGSSGSVPTITGNTSASFTATLNTPGDYYIFTIDVINDGSIDAVIDSVLKTPELTSEQAKYINYDIEYQNGESIDTNQLVEAGNYVRLKVKVSYRKDIVVSDLPSSSTILNLSFCLVYVQDNDNPNNMSIDSNGKSELRLVSGDLNTVGSEICIKDECFYLISNDGENVSMLSKYNLLVANKYDRTNGVVALTNSTGRQDVSAIGWFSSYSVDNPIIGVLKFSSSNYWSSNSLYPVYVYDNNSMLYEYVENYETYLKSLGVYIIDSRLIQYEELLHLGCDKVTSSCSKAPKWVYSTTYWTGSAFDNAHIWHVSTNTNMLNSHSEYNSVYRGIRPVVKISVSDF